IAEIKAVKTLGFEAVLGPLFPIWSLWLVLQIGLWFYQLIRAYLKAPQSKRVQIAYVLFGMGATALWASAVSLILPALGIFALANTDAPSTIFMTGFIGYALVQQELLSLRFLISRALFHSFIVGALAGLIVALVFAGTWFFVVLGIEGLMSMGMVVALLAFLIGELFFRKQQELELRTTELEAIKAQLEETKYILELKVKERTRELQALNATLEQRVEEKTRQLKQRIEELERFYRLTVERELKMVELKKELAMLQQRLENRNNKDLK
ncbi:MAG: hypothetical protein ACK4NX_01945, partial [Candidatus Paceibacteria bacterium]